MRPLTGAAVDGRGERIRLLTTDVPGFWVITLEPHGVTVDGSDGAADATISGSASSVWLSLMGRAVDDAEVPHLQDELNAILAFVEQLQEVNVEGVEPMTSVTPMAMKMRTDVVNDGEIADRIVANAPVTHDHFFLVPKVVE